ncbi:hypothetical protein A0257_07575 [Hymenobacter psoromatis]|nr:hypothetical protein A0257_07575 [Hymenobacter psoromatis]
MPLFLVKKYLLPVVVFLKLSFAVAQITPNAGEQAISIGTITESVVTGQDYSPWRDDNLNNLVQNCWLPTNFQYMDVTLKLQQTTVLTRLALFDYEGVFTSAPATIYAQYGTQRTLIGTFTGETYYQYVNMVVSGGVMADAIVIHKFSNNIPVKVKVFGKAGTAAAVQAVAPALTFGPLPPRTVGNAPFALAASSTNTAASISYTSSTPAVVSVSAATGQWLATVVGAGSATITASQAASANYLAASTSQTQLVQAAPTPPPAVTTASTSGKIPIDATRWYGLSNSPNNIQPLFDGSITTGSITGWGKIIPSYDTYYTFQPGEAMSIESIRFYDGGSNNMSDPMTLSVITNTGQRVAIGTYKGGHNYQWEGPDPNQLTNFKLPSPISNIRALVITATWGYPTEIELYGTYVPGTPLPVTNQTGVAVQKKIKLGQEMGVNGFEWDLEDPSNPLVIDETRLTAVKNFTGVRHYLDWSKLESTQGNFTYNPVHSGGWNYDVMYQRLKAEGIEVLACLKTVPDWMLASYPSADRDAENVPVRYGSDFSDPNSYIDQARMAFQYVARYGSNLNVNPALLHVDTSTRWFGDPANQIKIGLGYIKYVECDNERDKWWKGRKAYQTAFEYAANLSAFYDGNKNTMGAGVGVKNADPNMQVVMAGLASPNPDYVRGMIDWCRQNRGLKADGSVNLCWDVINYHLYSNDASTSQNGTSTRGSAPEVSNAGQVAQSFINMAHQYANDMPVWVTETGYDTNQGSPLHAPAIGGRSVLQTEADWTLRTALLYARWGVERTFFYELHDDNPTNPIQFGSSGLLNTDQTPKPAATFLRQANALLGAYSYTGTLNSDPLVDRYEANGKTIYALVVPDEKARTATYTLDLGTADSARIYQPQEGKASMLASRVKTQGGKVTLTVTETPQFVLAGGGATPATTAVACAGTGSIGWEQWTNIAGTSVAAIPVGTAANNSAVLTKLESAYNIGDNYGARIRGYICPPQSGSYTFQIAGDDDCQLWLSTDDTPANKVQLAGFSGWTNPGEWSKYGSQKSGTVSLVAGRRYYVEVLHKEGNGADFVAVGWNLPDGSAELPIAGSHLIPYTAPAATPAATACAGTGSIGWEQWTNVAGTSVANIPLATPPNVTATLTQLEGGRNIGDNYGTRIRGYLCPPQDGAYVFHISGDDDSQLWLSTDDAVANKVLIASVNGWTSYREWNKYSSQKSAAVNLLAGHRYYVEVLQKEAGGDDNVSVAWTLPSGQEEAPIAGSHLIPFTTTSSVAKTTASVSAVSSASALATDDGAAPAADAQLELQAYPNPFTGQTTIEFSLPAAGPVKLSVFDTRNQLVRQLYNGNVEAGVRQQFTLVGTGLLPGMYLLQLVTATNVVTKKLMRID